MNGKALRFGLGRPGHERKLKVRIAQHGLEAPVTDASLCASSTLYSVAAIAK
jgi:hypothetical protein